MILIILFKIFLRDFYAKTQFYRRLFSGRAVRLLGSGSRVNSVLFISMVSTLDRMRVVRSLSPIFPTTFPPQTSKTIRRTTIEKLSRTLSLSPNNEFVRKPRRGLSLSHEKSQTMRHGALSARPLFREGHYSICELPRRGDKGGGTAGSFMRWRNRKTRSLPRPRGKNRKKQYKRKCFRDLSDVFDAAYRSRRRQQGSRGNNCVPRFALLLLSLQTDRGRHCRSEREKIEEFSQKRT